MKKILMATWLALAGLVAVAQNIVRMEYFLDNDAGIGRNTIVTVTPAADGSFPFTVALAGIQAGKHVLSFRALDENGVWGETVRKVIEVLPNDGALTNRDAEYFFDNDPGFGNGYALIYPSPDSANQISFNANLSGLAPGRHGMFIRTHDSYGRWSISARTVVEVLPNDQPNKVIAGEYFFDNDPGFGNGATMTISPQDSVISQNYVVNVSGLSAGAHAMFSRVRDNLGTWGQTSRRTIDVTTAPDVNNVVSIEYSVRKDAGVGSSARIEIPVSSQNGTFNFQIPLQAFSGGVDTVYVRVKDQGISWANTSKFIVPIDLPLTILDFTAKRNDQIVALKWRTENEVNTSRFYIERSSDGHIFAAVGNLPARPMTLRSDYQYDDNIKGLQVPRLYYRLREVDHDGRITYSQVVSVDLSGKNSALAISPNPASDYIDIFPGTMLNGSDASVIISDLAGRVMIRQKLRQVINQRISVSSLTRGMYRVTIITNGFAQSQKIIINR